jgi:hypothetical protein
VSSVPRQAKSPAPPPDPLPQLGKLEAILRLVNEKPENLDASHERAHLLVRRTWYALFGEQGMLKAPEYKASRNGLKAAWAEENDWHETYTYGLETDMKRRSRDLNVAEALTDRGALVEGRRQYILRLQAFYDQALGLKGGLSEPSSSS